jgi:hypothetical protein
MKVPKVYRHLLHNEEWFGMNKDFYSLVEFFGAERLGIKTQFDLFKPLYFKADVHLLLLRKSVYTEQMKEADKDRGVCFLRLVDVTKGVLALSQPEPAQKTAAIRLDNLLTQYKQYGVKGGYDEESAGIYNLLQDLEGSYSADVNLLGLASWVEKLRQAEARFVDARAQRALETADKPQESLGEIRKQMDALYKDMIIILEAKLVADGLGGDIVIDADDLKNGVYESDTPDHLRGNITYNFVIRWNVYAKHYHDLLAARRGRSKKKDPDSPAESEPIPPVED